MPLALFLGNRTIPLWKVVLLSVKNATLDIEVVKHNRVYVVNVERCWDRWCLGRFRNLFECSFSRCVTDTPLSELLGRGAGIRDFWITERLKVIFSIFSIEK